MDRKQPPPNYYGAPLPGYGPNNGQMSQPPVPGMMPNQPMNPNMMSGPQMNQGMMQNQQMNMNPNMMQNQQMGMNPGMMSQQMPMPGQNPPSSMMQMPEEFPQLQMVSSEKHYGTSEEINSNRGKKIRVYCSFTDSSKWHDVIFEGTLYGASKNYLTIKQEGSESYVAIVCEYINYIEYLEKPALPR